LSDKKTRVVSHFRLAEVSGYTKLITQKARRDKMKYGESKVKINAAIG